MADQENWQFHEKKEKVDVAVQAVLPPPLTTVDTCPSYIEEAIQLPLPNNHPEIFDEVKYKHWM